MQTLEKTHEEVASLPTDPVSYCQGNIWVRSSLVICLISIRDTQLLQDTLSNGVSWCYSVGFRMLVSSPCVLRSLSRHGYRVWILRQEFPFCDPWPVNLGANAEKRLDVPQIPKQKEQTLNKTRRGEEKTNLSLWRMWAECSSYLWVRLDRAILPSPVLSAVWSLASTNFCSN